MTHRPVKSCPDCDGSLNRRSFIQQAGTAALAGIAIPSLLAGSPLRAAPSAGSGAETAVGEFYKSLSEAQKKEIVLPFEHELRKKINANWHITKPKIKDDFYTAQ